MKLSHWIGLLGVSALLSPMLAVGDDAPVPLPRRGDRMPGAAASPTPPPQALVPSAAPASPAAPAPNNRAVEAAVAAEPQPVTLVARITDGGADITDGLVWRVFAAHVDSAGELPLAARSDSAVARLSLTPGQYLVHVAYGSAQATDTITVDKGETDRALILDAGAMRLNAAVTGEIAIPVNLLRFDIYTAGNNEAERTMVAQNLGPSDIVTLNAGTYHVVSHFGEINALVRADLRVEPGQLTEATLYHRAAQVSFKLVSEPGGEAIADIDWTVKTPGGEAVFSTIGAFPATVLSEGEYVVAAKRGETTYDRTFAVTPGPAQEIEVLTTAR